MNKLELETIQEKIDMQEEALRGWIDQAKTAMVKMKYFVNQLQLSIDYLKTKLEEK